MKYVSVILLFIATTSIAQDNGIRVQKIGGFLFAKDEFSGSLKYRSKLWSVGVAHEIKRAKSKKLSTEVWGNYSQYYPGPGFSVKEYSIGLQKNWYPWFKKFGLNLIRLSVGVGYFGDTHNMRDPVYFAGLTMGIGAQQTLKRKWLVFADWDVVYAKYLNNSGFVSTFTYPIIGVGLSFN